MRPKNFVQLHQYKNNEIANKKLINGNAKYQMFY